MALDVTDKPDDLDRYARLLGEAEAIHGRSLAADAWLRLKRNRIALASLGFLVLISALAILTPLLPLQSPYAVDVRRAYKPPSTALWPFSQTLEVPESSNSTASPAAAETGDWIDKQFGNVGWISRRMIDFRVKLFGRWSIDSICGRDELGRDLLTRLFWGARISLAVGLIATLVSLLIGVSYGAISGYFGGRIDNRMMRFVDVLYCLPFIFIVIFINMIISQEDIQRRLELFGINRITVFFMVIGAIYWPTMARVVRGQVLSLKHEQFVEAARTIGANEGRILYLHIIPNLLSVIIVYLTLTIPRVMLFEAFLSFLGLGVQAPDVSWGLLANQGFHVITPVKIFWWLFVFPSLAMGLTLFALNFLGDGLRDALDPRLKNK
jgi:oligopeptide transport system permease protein